MGRILLFDLDGTLVTTGGAGRRAMERGFVASRGSAAGLAGMRFGGMTDQSIARAALRRMRLSDTPDDVLEVLDTYLGFLPEEVERSEGYRVLPGASRLLEALGARPGVALGLGTGNVERGAMVKLARGGLSSYFAFGGFGCDHEDRAELLRAGARRGAAALGAPLSECVVVVIGDTPLDVEAARRIGARCVGVATGGHAPEQLRGLGARAAFEDLEAPGVLEALLAP